MKLRSTLNSNKGVFKICLIVSGNRFSYFCRHCKKKSFKCDSLSKKYRCLFLPF